mmetsp:Transcript_19960/g.31252  ORF Transcript_19960/g.31252 Transcript_19960/m.31252 type:complete len:111 (-) Transcript_19960:163-495(-)
MMTHAALRACGAVPVFELRLQSPNSFFQPVVLNLVSQQPVGPYGTAENPVVIESINDERIVGCPGGCDGADTRSNNEIRWFVLTSAKPYTCPSCSQVYKLKKIDGPGYNF